MRDRGKPWVLSMRGDFAETRHYVYVDNIGVIGRSGDIVVRDA